MPEPKHSDTTGPEAVTAEGDDDMRDELHRRAFLHDDPSAYRAGVEDTLSLLQSRVEHVVAGAHGPAV